MTERGRSVLVVLLLVGAAVEVSRAAWPAPRLGPAREARSCARAVEVPGLGVRCDGAGGAPGDRIGGGRMAPARLLALGVPVDVNRAPEGELASLPGIGPEMARRIAAGRPYRTVEELGAVPGIGGKRLAAIAPRVVIGR